MAYDIINKDTKAFSVITWKKKKQKKTTTTKNENKKKKKKKKKNQIHCVYN